jgi:AcrR family transcriptional regulator
VTAKSVKPTRRRMTADTRRDSILEAARMAFAEGGDMTGTTIKMIARKAQISEGIIYRHFDSKEDLFIAAIVEPLRAYIDFVVDAASVHDGSDSRELRRAFWASMSRTMQKVLPNLGLVLFGEPKLAQKFYRTSLSPSIDELAASFERLYGTAHSDYPARVVALATFGIAIAVALDARYNEDYDPMGTIDALEKITGSNFWPEIQSAPADTQAGPQ